MKRRIIGHIDALVGRQPRVVHQDEVYIVAFNGDARVKGEVFVHHIPAIVEGDTVICEG